MVALFESLCVSYWQGGGMALYDSTATVSGSSYTSCSAGYVSECTWGPLQPDHVAHFKVWAMAHTSTLLSSPLLSSTHPHTPHPIPTHVAGCSLLCHAGGYGASIRSSVCCMANRSDMAIMVVAPISCPHDHQHLWLWIMNFRGYVSGLG